MLINIPLFYSGRPRKSSSDAQSSHKPKKLKTSEAQENNKHLESGREIIPGNVVHATQYSLSYNNPASDITLKNPDVQASKITPKSLLETALIKPSSMSAERLRQISRTYSTGSLPSSNSSPISTPSSAVPSFTLTFPIIPQNSESSLQNKVEKLKNRIYKF